MSSGRDDSFVIWLGLLNDRQAQASRRAFLDRIVLTEATNAATRSQSFPAQTSQHNTTQKTMLWSIIVILVVLWLAGLLFHVAGGLIHLLLVVAVIVFIVQMLTGRRGGV